MASSRARFRLRPTIRAATLAHDAKNRSATPRVSTTSAGRTSAVRSAAIVRTRTTGGPPTPNSRSRPSAEPVNRWATAVPSAAARSAGTPGPSRASPKNAVTRGLPSPGAARGGSNRVHSRVSRSGKKNPGGVTPTMVWNRPSTSSPDPTASIRAPSAPRQNASLITTSAASSASSGPKSRPRAGRTPSIGSRPGVTPAPATRIVSSGRVTACSRRSYPARSVRVSTPASRQA